MNLHVFPALLLVSSAAAACCMYLCTPDRYRYRIMITVASPEAMTSLPACIVILRLISIVTYTRLIKQADRRFV